MADTVAVMNAGRDRADGRPGRALREPAHDVRRQLPRPVQPDRGHDHRAAPRDLVTVDMHGIGVSVPTGRAHADGDKGWVGIRPEKVLIGDAGEAARRARATRSPAASSPTSASSASAPSTSSGCRGARSCRSSQQNTGRAPDLPHRRAGRALLATRVRLPPRRQPGRLGRRADEADDRDEPRRVRTARATDRLPAPADPGRRSGSRSSSSSRSTRWSPTSLFDPTGSDVTRLRDDLPLRELLARAPGLLAAAGALARRTARSRRCFCLVLGYVLAYAIAFKAGRWKNLMLVLVIAPFFTSFLVRTLSWKLILADDGFVVNTLQCRAPPRRRRPAARHAGRGDRRPDLQLPAVHGAAALRQHRQDRPPADRGVQRPLRQPVRRVLQGDLAAVAARRRLRAPCSPSSRRPATTSTPSCSAAPTSG